MRWQHYHTVGNTSKEGMVCERLTPKPAGVKDLRDLGIGPSGRGSTLKISQPQAAQYEAGSADAPVSQLPT